MSREIESRVVEMSFENGNFERNAKQSLSTLDKLKSALNFGKFADFSPVEDGLEKVTIAFDKMQIAAIAAITNIANRITNTFISAVKGMSVDQISAGWNKFAEVTTSTQTIISATGKDIDTVSNAVARLNWFTDETSYSLTDMTNNIGKFTSAGVDLDKSVNAMQGVATWAALSGANTGEASRAMYNLSQAMGSGAMLAIDWRSIENANMATREFKETAIQTARDMGVLNVSNEKAAEMVNNFRDTLSSKWFTGDVLTKTLEKYGGYATRLGEITEELGDLGYETTGQWNKAIDQYVKLTKESTEGTSAELTKFMEEQAKETGLSVEELTKYFNELGDETYDLGRKAFKAAQEAKTFQEVLDATKDAVSTGWMNTFQNIFGNYEEAKQIWSELADRMWELFAAGIDRRNNILKAWRESGDWAYIFGNPDRDGGEMYGALWNLLDAVQTIKDAIDEAFGTLDSDRLHNFSVAIYDFTGRISSFTDKYAPVIQTVLVNVKRGFDAVRDTISSLVSAFTSGFRSFKLVDEGLDEIAVQSYNAISPIRTLAAFLRELSVKVAPVFESLGRFVRRFFSEFKRSDLVLKFVNLITDVIYQVKRFADSIGSAISENEALSSFVEKAKSALLGIPSVLANIIDKVDEFVRSGTGEFIRTILGYLAKIPAAISKIWSSLKQSKILNNIKKILSDIPGTLASIREKVTSVFQSLPLQDFTSKLQNGGLGGLAAVGMIGADLGIGAVVKNMFSGFNSIGDLVAKIQTVADTITEPIKSLMESFKGLFGKKEQKDTFDVAAMKQFATSVAILSGSLLVLASIDATRLKAAIGALTILFLEMVAMFDALNTIVNMPIQQAVTDGVEKPTSLLGRIFGKRNPIKKANINSTMKALIAVAAGVLILSISMAKLASLNIGQMLAAFIVVSALLMEMIGVLKIVSGIKVTGDSLKQFKGVFLGLAGAILMIAISMKVIGTMDYGKMAASLVAVMALMLVMSILVRKMLEYGGVFGTAIGVAFTLIALATAIVALTVPLLVLAFIPWQRLIQGGLGILALMGILGGCVLIMSKFVKNAAGALAGGAAALLIAISVAAIVVALIPLSMLNWGALAKMGVSLLVVLGLLTAAMLLLSNPLVLVGAAAILVASGALLVISIALQKLSVALLALSAIGGGSVLGLLAGLGAGFIVLAVGLLALTAGIVGAVVLIMISGSLMKLAEAMFILSTVPIGKLLADILLLAAGMEIFGLVCISLSENFLKLLVGAAAVVVISAAVIAFSVALGILAVSISVTVTALLVLVEAVLIVVSTIGKLLNGCFDVSQYPSISGFGKNLFGALSSSTDGIWGKVKSFFGKKGNEIGEAVNDGASDTIEDGTSDVEKFAKESGISVADTNLNAIMSTFAAGSTDVSGVMSMVGSDGSSAFNMSFMDGLTNSGIDIPDEMKAMLNSNELNRIMKNGGYDAGDDLMEGEAEGINDNADKPINAAKSVAGRVVNITRNVFKERSPSKLFREIGAYLDEGLALGINDEADTAVNSAENMALSVANGAQTNLTSILSGIVDSINADGLANPVIRPVLDLSDIQNGASSIGGMFGRANVGVSGTYTMARAAYSNRSYTPDVIREVVPASVGGSNMVNNFYISGANPEEVANLAAIKIRDMVTSLDARY